MPFRWVQEARPGERWRQLFERTWPAYRRWFLLEGEARRPTLKLCRAQLERHMPELLETWERLVELTGGDPEAARMLSLYRPSPYLVGCSQALWTRGEPLLVRNYDYHPGACEGLFLLSSWTGTPVLASSDCLWGALDGLNGHGLALALAFGGRQVVGDGFGVPLLLRYALETCRTTAEAVAALSRVPIHMAYNVSVLDASGARALLQLAPDRAPVVNQASVAANHQRPGDWHAYEERTHSLERERHLQECLSAPGMDVDSFQRLFLEPPLFASDYEHGHGTLYTAAYSPTRRSATYSWREARVEQQLERFREQDLLVPLGAAVRPAP